MDKKSIQIPPKGFCGAKSISPEVKSYCILELGHTDVWHQDSEGTQWASLTMRLREK